MDIIIKSFNRPYYLDRCIQSIYLNCIGYDFKIMVLDDGTPKKYLDKLQDKYPDIVILKSEFYSHKSEFCEQGKKPDVMEIPLDFWIDSVKNASEYFVLLEDDIWINQKVDFDKMIQNAIEENVSFIKLFWIGNPLLKQSKSEIVKSQFTIVIPKLYTIYPFIYNIVFFRFHRFGIRKMLKKLKIHTHKRALSYYTIYSVAGNVFKKDYFLSVWENHNNQIQEEMQLFNAVKYYLNTKIKYANSNSEIVTQGILSAATNQFKEFDGVHSDMFAFNKIVNEAWFENRFDTMDTYPKELNMSVIEAILEKENNPAVTAVNWEKWVVFCKNQYRNFGCIVE